MASTDYSAKDFTEVYEELVEIVESGTTTWKPSISTEADPGVVILKLMALLEDKANYRFDMAQAQGYLDSVSDRQSAYDLLKMLGYIMKQARAATGTVQVSRIPSGFAALRESETNTDGTSITSNSCLVLPKFTALTDATKTLSFFTTKEVDARLYSETDTDKTEIEDDDKEYSVPVMAGELFQITKDGSATFSLKDIDEQGRLYLGKADLAQNGIFIRIIDDSDTNSTTTTYIEDVWTYLDFSILKPSGRWYSVGTSENDEMYIQFPDDFEDLIGTVTFEVWATYTQGSAMNISAGLLSVFVEESWKTYFAVRQDEAFYTGQDAETISTATQNYYNTKDVCDTLLTASDFTSAIRYLLVSVATDDYPTVGDSYFSSAIVRTANERKTKVRTISFGTEYTLYVPDLTESTNQIDVIGLQASSNYVDTFKRVTSEVDIESIQNDIGEQLYNEKALDVDVVIDTETPRLLAVTSPEMVIRISNYTDTKATTIKQAIQTYLYTNYSADKLTPGTALDEQTIVEDIKELSTNILSVSAQPFEYKIYETYEAVDGETQAISSDLQTRAAALAVLAGDVPLFKYYNRQNTTTKLSAAYSVLAEDSSSEGLESVLYVPLNATSYDSIANDEAIAPTVKVTMAYPTSVTEGSTGITKLSGGFKSTDGTSQDNLVIQIRKPVHTSTADYGYGMQYYFLGHKKISNTEDNATGIALLKDATLTAGTVLAAGTVLKNAEITDSDGNTLTGYGSGETFPAAVQLTATLSVPAGSFIANNSYIATGSTFEGVTYTITVSAGTEYQLQKYEVLKLTDSSGSTLATLTYGDWFMPTGFDLAATTYGSSSTVLTSTNTISVLEDDCSTITTDFVYFLTLRRNDTTIGLSPSGKSVDGYYTEYMLEDGEYFIYADKGVTEYVVLGPGTLLKNATSSAFTLTNTPFADITELTASMFTNVPGEIEGQSCEITNYTSSNAGAFVFTFDSAYTDASLPLDWYGDGPGVATLTVYAPGTYSTTNGIVDGDGVTVSDALAEYTFTEDGQFRVALQLESDSYGVAAITGYAKLQLTWSDTEEPVEVSSKQDSATSGESACLVASTPFSGVFAAATDGATLLTTGVSARFSQATYATPLSEPSVETAYSVSSSSSSYEVLFGTCVNVERDHTDTPLSFNVYPVADSDNDGYYAFLLHITFKEPPREGVIYLTATNTTWLLANLREIETFEDFTSSNYDTNQIAIDLSTTDRFGVTVIGRISSSFTTTKNDEGTSDGSAEKNCRLVFTLDSNKHADAFTGMTMIVSDLSYIKNYAAEVLYSSTDEDDNYTPTFYGDSADYSLVQAVLDADTENRFNWTCMPSEEYANPTYSANYFEELHPFNSLVIPYIAIDWTKIKVIKGR